MSSWDKARRLVEVLGDYGDDRPGRGTRKPEDWAQEDELWDDDEGPGPRDTSAPDFQAYERSVAWLRREMLSAIRDQDKEMLRHILWQLDVHAKTPDDRKSPEVMQRFARTYRVGAEALARMESGQAPSLWRVDPDMELGMRAKHGDEYDAAKGEFNLDTFSYRK